MRRLPETLPEEGLLVGWSLEARRRKPAIGFTAPGKDYDSPAKTLEPILDSSEGHLISIAPTGAGKGVGCIIPALLRYPGPVVVVDPKGENYAVTAEQRRRMGQEVVLLDPFNVTSEAESQRFNPMDLANPKSSHFVEDISTLATLAAKNTGDVGMARDPFWPQMGRVLVTAAILDVLTMPDSTDATLPAARALLNQPLEQLIERAKKWQKADNAELRQMAGLMGNPADTTMGGYWALAINQLDFLKGKLVTDHLRGSDLDLNAVYRGDPVSIYLVLPPDKLESHSPLLRLWIGSLISVLSRRAQRPEKPTLMLIDEAAQLGELPQLRSAITLLRGYGVRVWSFWQDLSQLQRLYPSDWETILNNCRIQQFFGATTGMAAESVASVSGFGPREAVLELEPDELILNVAGDEPVVVRRPNYLFDPPFQGLYTQNPFYGSNQQPTEPQTRAVFRRSEAPKTTHERHKTKEAMALSQQIFHPVSSEHWVQVEEDEKQHYLEQMRLQEKLDSSEATLYRCDLPFYDDFDWYDLQFLRKSPTPHAYFVASDTSWQWLDGQSNVIHNLNASAPVKLAQDNLVRYLRFFCSSIYTSEGRFLVVESVDELEWREEPEPSFKQFLQAHLHPPRTDYSEQRPEQGWILSATVVYGDLIADGRFHIGYDGTVAMLDDTEIASDLPLIPDLERLRYIGTVARNGVFKPADIKD